MDGITKLMKISFKTETEKQNHRGNLLIFRLHTRLDFFTQK